MNTLSPAERHPPSHPYKPKSESTQTNSSVIAVHSLNETCFKKCTTSKSFTSATLDRSEETCAANCVDRWMDSQMLILQKLGSMRGQ
jgi:import inner membrane translocase subunit TIM8